MDSGGAHPPFQIFFVRKTRFPTRAELANGDMLNLLDRNFYHGRTWLERWWQGLAVNTSGTKTVKPCEQCSEEGRYTMLYGCKVLPARDEKGSGAGRARGVVRSCGNCLFDGKKCSFKKK